MSNKYSVLARLLHWSIGALVLVLFGLGVWMDGLDYYSQWYQKAPALHVSLGVLFIIGLTVRIANRLLSRTLEPLPTWRRLEVLAAHGMHIILYILMLAMAFTGYVLAGLDDGTIDCFGWFQLPAFAIDTSDYEDQIKSLHELLAFSLIGLALGHAFIALKHHFYNKDRTLKRML